MKKTLAALIGMVMLFLIPIHANAHPGSTDGRGGHYDRSTGEYHYHHGFSAHNHYDMDGDGIDDCPYNFVDKTDTSNRGSNSSEDTDSGINYSRPSMQPSETKEIEENDSKKVVAIKEKKKMPPWGYWVIGILVLIAAVQHWLIRSLSSDIDSHINSIHSISKEKQEIEADFKKFQEESTKDRKTLEDQLHKSEVRANGQIISRDMQIHKLKQTIELLEAEKKSFYETHPFLKTEPLSPHNPVSISIPEDVYFTKDNIPVKGIVSDYAPFGDFTVFVSKKGKKFHQDDFCGGAIFMKAVHIYDVLDDHAPCDRCFFLSQYRHQKVPEWYKNIKALQKTE